MASELHPAYSKSLTLRTWLLLFLPGFRRSLSHNNTLIPPDRPFPVPPGSSGMGHSGRNTGQLLLREVSRLGSIAGYSHRFLRVDLYGFRRAQGNPPDRPTRFPPVVVASSQNERGLFGLSPSTGINPGCCILGFPGTAVPKQKGTWSNLGMTPALPNLPSTAVGGSSFHRSYRPP